MAAGDPVVAVKIGMTTVAPGRDLRSALVQRLSAVQSSNHECVELLGVVPLRDVEYPGREAEALERELHLEFEHLVRFKPGTRGGEWFTASADLMAKIGEIAMGPEQLGLPRSVYVPR
jgi:hypothetical protein